MLNNVLHNVINITFGVDSIVTNGYIGIINTRKDQQMNDSTLLAATMIFTGMFCVPVMVIGAALVNIPVFIAGFALAFACIWAMAGLFLTSE
tara:strand:- start:561 stop:836 length:276 start_codon:yes stop_codon:yes gene_type:complete